jgi:hypothetical protein
MSDLPDVPSVLLVIRWNSRSKEALIMTDKVENIFYVQRFMKSYEIFRRIKDIIDNELYLQYIDGYWLIGAGEQAVGNIYGAVAIMYKKKLNTLVRIKHNVVFKTYKGTVVAQVELNLSKRHNKLNSISSNLAAAHPLILDKVDRTTAVITNTEKKPDKRTNKFVCPKCRKSFDTQRGLNIHTSRSHR